MTQANTATSEQQAAWHGVVSRAWTDQNFKQRLIDDPNAVLKEQGLAVPQGINFVVVENEPDRVHLVLPSKPGDELAVSELHLSDYDPGF